MEQVPVVASEEVKKPRKRFIGRAKKSASTEANTDGAAIEDGAVGFASKVILSHSITKLNITHFLVTIVNRGPKST